MFPPKGGTFLTPLQNVGISENFLEKNAALSIVKKVKKKVLEKPPLKGP